VDIVEQITAVFADFANPKKRVFFGYLALSVLIALLWLVLVRKTPLGAALRRVFDRQVFLSPSARADYKIFVINRMFTFWISPLLLSQVAIATGIYFFLHRLDFLTPSYFSGVSTGVVVALFTIVLFLVDDLSKYLVHRWMHRFPLLWAIHKVHHSATTLTPVTVYRVHPLEGVLYSLRGVVAQGTVIPVFYYLFGSAVSLYTVVGVNVLVFIFHVTGSNLRHSHISIRYWPWLEHLLISPAQHQLHHSVAERHFDKNFGAALAVWDWMFRSLHLSEAEGELTFGLDEQGSRGAASLWVQYMWPLRDMGRILRRRARRLAQMLRIVSAP
jgi:sterol desaturase/sphingolipid hydroxylase (fatty acid hydroxylase superfamily)